MMGVFLALFLAVGSTTVADAHRDPEKLNKNDLIVDTGEPFVVWDTQDSKCNNYKNPLDLPDVPARAFVDDKNITHLITADTTTWISYGSSILNVTRNCTIAFNATLDPDPSAFAADEFLDATYSFGNGTVVALIHTEYPGNRFNNCVAETAYPRCWTVTIGLAVSHDWGYSWKHARPPPNHLVASVPYKYDPTGRDFAFGWGDTSGIVRNPHNGWYFVAMFNRNPIGLQHNGTCVMRTKTLLDPKSWRGWNGTHFSVAFADPYRISPENEANHVCSVLRSIPASCNMLGVTYSLYLDRFVASLWCPFHSGNISPRQPFFFATSRDMVNWGPLQKLFDPFHQTSHPSYLQNAAYPTLMDSLAPFRKDFNYETIGQQATLFYVQITRNFFAYGRQLMGVNVTFHMNEDPEVTS